MKKYAFGTKAGLKAGIILAIAIDIDNKEILVWDGTEQPNLKNPELKDKIFVRTFIATKYGTHTVVAVSLVANQNDKREITEKMVGEVIAATQNIITEGQFAGASHENGRVVTAMNYGGTVELTPEIVDFTCLNNGNTPKVFTLGRQKAKIFDLATQRWEDVKIEGVMNFAQVRGITRFVPYDKGGRYTSLLSVGTDGNLRAIELVVDKTTTMKVLPGIIKLKDFGEVVGPIVGQTEKVGGFNKLGQVITMARNTFALQLENAGAPTTIIAAYAQPGFGV